MTKRLLTKTQRIYSLLSIIILIIIAPSFYYLIEKLYLNDVDEALLNRKTEFIQNFGSQISEADITAINRFNSGIQIIDSIRVRSDSLFNDFYLQTSENELEPYRVLYTPFQINGRPYTLAIKSSLIESADLLSSIAIAFFTIIVLLLIALLLITKRMSASTWKPFYDTLEKVESFKIDSGLLPKLVDSDIEEFNRLNISIQQLIGNNLLIYQSQKEFLENAAHELQTPIAVFQSKIDLLIQGSDLTESQSQILNSLYESVSRLNRLNKNLLLLSKIENKQFKETDEFSIRSILEKQLDFFNEQAQQKKLRIELDLSDDILVKSDTDLCEILLRNLFMNAISHNILNGQISIKTNENSLTFSNSGIEKKLNSDLLFQRFYKANKSEGNGLGLAIIKKIIEINNWQIAYQYDNTIHSFSIHF